MKTSPEPGPSKTRADARRNRERLLAAAHAVFAESGTDVGLDEVARRAGVGVGTLYRHFPTRDALVEAVYRSEVQGLAEAQVRLSQSHTPVEALRAWMRLFVDYIATKKILAPALNYTVGESSALYVATSDVLVTAIGALVQRAVESGDMRADLDPLDLLRALVGVSNVASAPHWAESARRLIDILLLGSRPA